MAKINYSEMFPLADDPTPYRKISDDFVSLAAFAGGEILNINARAVPADRNRIPRYFPLPAARPFAAIGQHHRRSRSLQ